MTRSMPPAKTLVSHMLQSFHQTFLKTRSQSSKQQGYCVKEGIDKATSENAKEEEQRALHRTCLDVGHQRDGHHAIKREERQRQEDEQHIPKEFACAHKHSAYFRSTALVDVLVRAVVCGAVS